LAAAVAIVAVYFTLKAHGEHLHTLLAPPRADTNASRRANGDKETKNKHEQVREEPERISYCTCMRRCYPQTPESLGCPFRFSLLLVLILGSLACTCAFLVGVFDTFRYHLPHAVFALTFFTSAIFFACFVTVCLHQLADEFRRVHLLSCAPPHSETATALGDSANERNKANETEHRQEQTTEQPERTLSMRSSLRVTYLKDALRGSACFKTWLALVTLALLIVYTLSSLAFECDVADVQQHLTKGFFGSSLSAQCKHVLMAAVLCEYILMLAMLLFLVSLHWDLKSVFVAEHELLVSEDNAEECSGCGRGYCGCECKCCHCGHRD